MNRLSEIPNIPSNIGEAVLRTILFLNESEGSSYDNIEKYLLSLYRESEDKPDPTSIQFYLKNAVDGGILLKLDSGNYKIKDITMSCRPLRKKHSRSRRKHTSSKRQRSPNQSQNLFNVQHFDFSTPIRCDKDIIFPSAKTFERYALHQKRICSFCENHFDVSEHLNEEQQRTLSEDYRRNLAKSYNLPKIKSKTDSDQNKIGLKRKLSKLKKQSKKKFEEIMDQGYSKVSTKKQQDMNGSIQKKFPLPESRKVYHDDEKINGRRDHIAGKRISSSGCYELRQVCIHAFVHEPSAGDCECGKCVELGKKDGLKLESYLTTKGPKSERTVKRKEQRQPLRRSKKHTSVVRRKVRRSHTGYEPRLLTPVSEAESQKQTPDTDTSTLNESDIKILTKRAKIISEEDYKRKKQKLKKQIQKLLEKAEEESTTTVSTATPGRKEELKEKIIRLERRSILTIIDEKCTSLRKMTRANLMISLFVMLIVCGNLACCLDIGDIRKFQCLPKTIGNLVSWFKK